MNKIKMTILGIITYMVTSFIYKSTTVTLGIDNFILTEFVKVVFVVVATYCCMYGLISLGRFLLNAIKYIGGKIK